jgi:hypothetical protein
LQQEEEQLESILHRIREAMVQEARF